MLLVCKILQNDVRKDVDGCNAHDEDFIVCSDSLKEHLTHLYHTFDNLGKN